MNNLKKWLALSVLLAVCLTGITCKANSNTIFFEDFEDPAGLQELHDENSSVGISEVYGYNGSETKALEICGTSAIFDVVQMTDSRDSVLSFDFLPMAVNGENYVFFSMFSGNETTAILSICDEGLMLGDSMALDIMHIEWHKIKLIVSSSSMQLFVNGMECGEKKLNPGETDLSSVGFRFCVAGGDILYLDNFEISKYGEGDILVEEPVFSRYNCRIEEMVCGEIDVRFSMYNYCNTNEKISVYCAAGIFSDRKLQSFAGEDAALEGGECKTVTLRLTVSDNTKEDEIRAFILDKGMKPISGQKKLK